MPIGRARTVLVSALCLGLVSAAGLPAQATSSTVVDGVVVQLSDSDGATGGPLVQVAGEFYALPDSTAAAELPTGTAVSVQVRAPAGMSTSDALSAADEPSGGVSVDVAPVALPDDVAPVTGVETVKILPVYWPGLDPIPVAELQQMGQAGADYWANQSDGAVQQQVTVAPWASIPVPVGCDVAGMLNLALSANGMSAPSSHQHVVVYFPHTSECWWAGLGSVGGGLIWVNGYTMQDVIAHEFGHNLGLGHANTLTCSASGHRVALMVPTSACTSSEYGDYADVMGGATGQPSGDLNAGFADFLGFVQVTRFTATSRAATVELSPPGDRSGPRAVAIDSTEGTVYVEYRPAWGLGTRRAAWSGVQVRLRRADATGVPVTWLLDLGGAGTVAFGAPQLAVGPTWAVPGSAMTVTVLQTGSRAEVRVAPTTDALIRRYVTRVYEALFGRDPDPVGLEAWTAGLEAGQSRASVALGITSSDEYRSSLVAGAYSRYLGRAPDPAGADSWLRAMRVGLAIDRLEAGFLASDEAFAAAGGTQNAWVGSLYQRVLGRSASPSEVAAWAAALSRGASRVQVADGFLLSGEHLGSLLQEQYQGLLGRGADPVGLAAWIATLQAGTRWESVIAALVASDEYFGGS